MKKRIAFYIPVLLLFMQTTGAQTVVVTDDPSYTTGNASAMLDVKSTTKGILVPRVTLTAVLANASPVTSPATGLLVYNEGASQPVGFYYWNGSAWASLSGSSSANGSETIVTATIPISKTGTGTVANPYVVTFTTQSVTRSQRDALTPYSWQYVWCSDCGTGELQVFNGMSWTNSTGGSRSLAIGEPYQGGKVAYILQPGDFGYVAGEVRGFIAASSDNTNGVAWGCGGFSIAGADGTAIGTGTQNTTDIITGCISAGIPASVAFDYSVTENGVTYRDWFLPSLSELQKLYDNRTAIGGFNTGLGTSYYWTSSELSSTNVSIIYFFSGATSSVLKANTTYYSSRAIRYFTGGTPDIPQIGLAYQGGIIAYIYQPGDPGYVAGQYHGIIAAPYDQGTAALWGCTGTSITGAAGTALGTGAQNTIDIVAGCAEAGRAARLCSDLVLAGYSDWSLPSKDDLNKLYLNKALIGASANFYWSSTQQSASFAWDQNFADGLQYSVNKSNTLYVRAVRYF